MKETVLILGNFLPLRNNLVESLINKDKRIIIPYHNNKEVSKDMQKHIIFLNYNRRSFISTRTLFLECKNRNLDITHILILHSILEQTDIFQGTQNNIIDDSIDEYIKGCIFFLRESFEYLEKKGNGSVNIILHRTGPKIAGPLEELLIGGIEALTSSLLKYYGNEVYALRGYYSNDSNISDYADYVSKSILENQKSGKWYRHRNMFKFFPFLYN